MIIEIKITRDAATQALMMYPTDKQVFNELASELLADPDWPGAEVATNKDLECAARQLNLPGLTTIGYYITQDEPYVCEVERNEFFNFAGYMQAKGAMADRQAFVDSILTELVLSEGPDNNDTPDDDNQDPWNPWTW
jgi:hypothetical protein